MKNFLKSMALFACAVLLFGACSEETTEDIAAVVVSAPTDVVVTPGDGKIYIEWSVPTVCDADRSRITWYNAEGVQVGRNSYLQVAAGTAGYTYVTNKFYEGTEPQVLPAGTYTVSIENYISKSLEYSKEVKFDVEVYNSESYTDKMPTVAECTYEAASTTTYDATIEWGVFDGDCTSVTVFYGDNQSIELAELTSGATTVMAGVEAGSEYYYVSTFCPANGQDEVSVESAKASFSTKPVAPTEVSAVSGAKRFQVNYTLDAADFENVDYVLVAYGDNEYKITEDLVEGANATIVPEVESGSYAVSVYAVSAEGILSDVAAVEAEVAVYDVDSFSYPMITEVVNTEGVIEVYAGLAENLISFDINVTNGTDSSLYTMTKTTNDEGVDYYYATFNSSELEFDAVAATIEIANAAYCPEGVVSVEEDTVTLETEDSGWVVPVSVQYAPTITSVKTYKTGNVEVEWSMQSTTDIAKSIVTLTYGSSTVITKEISENIATEGNNCVFTIADDGLVAGYSYTATVKTVSTQDNSSADSEAKEGIFVYDESSYANYAPAVSKINFTCDSYDKRNEFDAVITWESYLNESLVGLYAEYGGEQTVNATIVAGEIKSSATIEKVAFEGGYSYTAEFKPAGEYAQDAVEVTINGTLPAIIAPELAEYSVGYTAAAGAEAASSSITTTFTAENYFGIVNVSRAILSPEEVADFNIDTYVFSAKSELGESLMANFEKTNLVPDTEYTIYAQTNGYGDEKATFGPFVIKTYGEGTYTAASAEGFSYTMTNTEGEVSISWITEGVEDLSSITYSYTDEASAIQTVTVTDFSQPSVFTPAADLSEVTYTLGFRPEYGEDDVVVEDDSFVITLMDPAPADPTISSVEYGYTEANGAYATISWAEVTATESTTAAVEYFVKIGEEGTPESTGTELTHTFTALTAGTEYTLYVAAVNSEGTYSGYTAATAFTAYTPSTYTEALPTLAATAEAGKISLAFTESEDAAKEDLVSVTYTYGSEGNEQTATVAKADLATAIELTYEEGETSISYSAAFKPATGADEVSVVATDVVFAEPAPTAPTAVVVEAFGYDVAEASSYATISWTAPETSNPAVAEYAVYAIEASAAETKLFETTTKELTYTFEGLTADKSYTFYVASLSDAATASSDTATAAAITAFDATGCELPTYTIGYAEPTVTVTWSEFTSGSLTYTYGAEATETAVVSGTPSTFTYEDGFTSFDYTMVFDMSSKGEKAVDIALSGAGVFSVSDFDLTLNAEGIYEIYTAKGLAAFGDLVNGTDNHFTAAAKSGEELPAAGSVNVAINGKLMADISLSTICGAEVGASWAPIGKTDTQYAGTFDGNNKTIYDLYIHNEGLNLQGLFGWTYGATIKNLTLANVDLSIGGGDPEVILLSGSLVGLADKASTISGCEVSGGNVVSNNDSAATHFGGVIGRLSAGTLIENCINRANVKTTTQQAGGIVGSMFPGTATSSKGSFGSIKGCTNYGKIEGQSYNAGIIGYYFATTAEDIEISDCANYGEIVASGTCNGGLIGSIRATQGRVDVKNCVNYATGTVTVGGQYSAGVLGQTNSSDGAIINVTNCENYATVESTGSDVGGIVGADYYRAAGNLTISKSTNNGSLKGTKNVGGIMGYTTANVKIIGDEESTDVYYNNGDVTGTTVTNIGGLVGELNGSLMDYNNSGEVTVAGVNKNGTDVNGVTGKMGADATVGNCYDTHGLTISGAEPVTVTTPALNDNSNGIVVEWAYSNGISNIANVVVYYRAAGETEYMSKISEGNTATSLTLTAEDGILASTTYEVYVETVNMNGESTASTNGGTAEGALSVVVPVAAADSDIYYYASTNTYEIRTASGLKAFADIVNGTAVTTPADLKTNVTVEAWAKDLTANAKVMNAIALGADEAWTPMGTDGAQYTGTFDGGNYAISNLYINATAAGQGLFGYVGAGAQIKNVNLASVNITSTAGSLGAVAGMATNATIENCNVSGAIKSADVPVGGIVGANAGSAIKDCTNEATINVTSTAAGAVAGIKNGVGGIVGAIKEGTADKVDIDGCVNNGEITSKSNGVGGIIGFAFPTNPYVLNVANCVNTAPVSGAAWIGGICGYSRSAGASASHAEVLFTDCLNSGDIHGTDNNVAGIVACAVQYTITRSSNSGNITGDGATKKGFVGGLTGQASNGGSITGPGYNTGNITATVAGALAGGLVGSAKNPMTISNYTNAGAVYVAGVLKNGDQTTDHLAGSGTVTYEECTDTYVFAADAEAVTFDSATSTASGFDIAWSYGASVENISYVMVYYKVAGAESFSSEKVNGNTTTSLSLDVVTGESYEYYITSANVNSKETESVNGGTMTEPLTIAVTLAAADSDLYLTEDNVYEVRTAEGLMAFADIVNGTSNYTSVASNVTSWSKNTAANAKLINDIELNTVCGAKKGNWAPMGAASNAAYSGTFDGNGKTISNLYINNAAVAYQAMFAYANNATFKNVTMSAPVVTGLGNTSAFVGNLTGNSTIDNCHLTGAGVITANGQNNGGFVGYANGATLVISNCTVGSEMVLDGSLVESSSGSYGAMGGIVGSLVGTVVNCSNNAAEVKGNRNVAGIAGFAGASTFIGCSNRGYVYSGKSAGGMVGKSGGMINFVGCYNTGEVAGLNTTASEVAGIAGCTNSSMDLFGCYSTGVAVAGLTGYKAAQTYNYTECYYNNAHSNKGMYNNEDSLFPGMSTIADNAALNAKVEAMNAALVAYYTANNVAASQQYLYKAGATATDYPTVSAVE